LPKKSTAAAAVIRARLSKEDGDADGVVSDIELLKGLYSITPGLVPSDCNFLIKYLSKRFNTDPGLPPDVTLSSTSRGIVQGISAKDVAEWFVAQPGGMPGKLSATEEPSKEPDDRLGSRAQKFNQFRAGWEDKYGAPARKEMEYDAAEKPEGPTWTKAEPVPFRVVHLASAPPPSAKKA